MRVRNCEDCNVSFRLPQGNCPYEISIQWIEWTKKNKTIEKTIKNKKEKTINSLDKWM